MSWFKFYTNTALSNLDRLIRPEYNECEEDCRLQYRGGRSRKRSRKIGNYLNNLNSFESCFSQFYIVKSTDIFIAEF